MVSHDRGLLDRAVTGDRPSRPAPKLSLTPGGYTEFVRIRTEQAMQQARAAERIAAQRAHMQTFVDRFRATATKARQAQARLKALEKLPVDRHGDRGRADPLRLPRAGNACRRPSSSLDRVSVGYGAEPVLRGLSLSIDMDDRIALLGANGNGKSTLAKLHRRPARPLAGEMRRPGKLRVGYFAQHQEAELIALGNAGRPHERARCRAPRRRRCARNSPASAWTRTVPTRPRGNLSGGERARLLLALATRDAPQLLILDEPTNHLDIDAATRWSARWPSSTAPCC